MRDHDRKHRDKDDPGDESEPSQGIPSRLPGVGTRYDFTDQDGQPLVVVARSDGGCDLYPASTARQSMRLDAATTRSLAAALGAQLRIAPDLVERFDAVLGGLVFDWVRVPRQSPATGETIESLQVRQRTGVTIVAVLRGSLPIVSPEPSERLLPGDELVLVGREADVDTFHEIFQIDISDGGA